jgi:hypothetical protein
MGGLQRLRAVQVVRIAPAFIHSLRRGHYELGMGHCCIERSGHPK